MQYRIITVTDFQQNCSLIWCRKSRSAALIDPGGESQKIKKEIKVNNVIVKAIWITHGHLDHVGAVTELSSYYEVPIFGPHFQEQPLLKDLVKQCKMFGKKNIAPLKPNYWLSDNDSLNIGRLSFRVLHCPGHSPGHVIFWNQEERFLLIGDLLFKGSIGRTDLPGGDKAKLAYSIRYKVLPLGEDVTFIPGHGLISTLGYESQTNFYLKKLLKETF